MKYDIYFHNDFDGRASAAVMLNFLESRGDEVENYFAVDHDIKQDWPKYEFENPAIVLDFLYHPKAIFWFDHHPTAFLKKEWKKKFRQSGFHIWETDAPSACGLVLKSLVKNFGYKPPRHMKELTKWLDIIDMAEYKSAKQTIEKKEPALKLEELIDYKKRNHELTVWLIRKMNEESVAKVAEEKSLREIFSLLESRREKAIDFYRKNLEIYSYKLAFLDFSRGGFQELRFAPFYLAPGISYSLVLKKSGHARFHITLGMNPWKRDALKKNKISIGDFLEDNYGGGGHRVVGGAEFKSREDAEKAIAEIIEKFSK